MDSDNTRVRLATGLAIDGYSAVAYKASNDIHAV